MSLEIDPTETNRERCGFSAGRIRTRPRINPSRISPHPPPPKKKVHLQRPLWLRWQNAQMAILTEGLGVASFATGLDRVYTSKKKSFSSISYHQWDYLGGGGGVILRVLGFHALTCDIRRRILRIKKLFLFSTIRLHVLSTRFTQ